MVNNADLQLAELGIFVHGVLAAFHMLGIVYNVKHRNWFDVTMHGMAAAYDVFATGRHIRQVGHHVRM